MSARLRPILIAAALVTAFAAWFVWSYETGGLMAVLLADPPVGVTRLEAFRAYVLAWGPVAPLVYVLAVTVEVVVVPIPGALLYAPGGAIFGGLVGGALSLLGNVIGAALACWIARTCGEAWIARKVDGTQLARHRDRLRARGGWIVFVLRLNPFTSSDLVSYAAGLAGVPVGQVAIGTLFGMAPQCFLQAYLAASLFEILPASPLVIAGVALAIAVAVIVVVLKRQ